METWHVNKEESGAQMEGGDTRVLSHSSSGHTPGCHPSLLEALPKTHCNQIIRNTQQGTVAQSVLQ